MKRFFCVVMMGLFLAGCGTAAKESEFWKHSSMYSGWGHMKYSINPENCTAETTKKSQQEKWWGIQQNECPGK